MPGQVLNLGPSPWPYLGHTCQQDCSSSGASLKAFRYSSAAFIHSPAFSNVSACWIRFTARLYSSLSCWEVFRNITSVRRIYFCPSLSCAPSWSRKWLNTIARPVWGCTECKMFFCSAQYFPDASSWSYNRKNSKWTYKLINMGPSDMEFNILT